MKARQICCGMMTTALLGLLAGCALTENQFRESGPATKLAWDSPTAADVQQRFQPAPPRTRDWDATMIAAEDGAVSHYPSYFEDPFEDKGHGRTDATHPYNVYRGGWEDYVALAYCPARLTANLLLLPVSAVVTPPWTVMESDGRLSRQLLGYDHDATPVRRHVPRTPPAASATAPSRDL